MGEDRTYAHSGGRGADRLTIAEAAALLGVHKNTVRNRIKNGLYRAEMVQTERGPTYLIEHESLLTNLTTNTLSSASQKHGTAIVSPQSLAFVQELLRPFVNELGQVREELGAERNRRQMAEERVAELEGEIAALKSPLEPAEPEDQEPPESPAETPSEASAPTHAGGEAQEATERQEERKGWFRRFFGL